MLTDVQLTMIADWGPVKTDLRKNIGFKVEHIDMGCVTFLRK